MVKLLEASEIDLETEAIDQIMTDAEEKAELATFVPPQNVGDLSDGGRVGRATLYPTQNGKPVSRGRANARQAWMWDGTPSVLALAWNPEGTRHDGGRAYLTKRHCLCCGASGFRGDCKKCIDKNCAECNLGRDRKKNIRCFYLRKEEVPFQQKFYGNVDCFLPLCVRRGGQGFKTEADMRMHARFRHRFEYAAHQEVLAAQKATETDDLKQQVAELRGLLLSSSVKAESLEMVQTRESAKPTQPRRRRRATSTIQ